MRCIGTIFSTFYLFALSCGSVFSAFLVQEDFAYVAPSSLNGANGGTGWAGAWTGSPSSQTQAPGLTFPGETTTGNKAVLPFNGSTYSSSRVFSQSINGTIFTTASFSFLFNLTGNDSDTGIRFAGLSLFSGATEVFFFGKPGNTTQIGIHKYAGGEETLGISTSYTSSTVFQFNADFTLASAGNSSVNVQLLDNQGEGGTSRLLQQWSGLGLGEGFAFDRITLIRDFALDFDINADFDAISLQAIPEPSMIGMLSLGAGLFCLRRMRNKQAGKS
jgi:hypothetical protein